MKTIIENDDVIIDKYENFDDLKNDFIQFFIKYNKNDLYNYDLKKYNELINSINNYDNYYVYDDNCFAYILYFNNNDNDILCCDYNVFDNFMYNDDNYYNDKNINEYINFKFNEFKYNDFDNVQQFIDFIKNNQ